MIPDLTHSVEVSINQNVFIKHIINNMWWTASTSWLHAVSKSSLQ